MELSAFVPYASLLGAAAAIVYGALKYNREDAGQVVEQQSKVVGDMDKLNVHLRAEIDRLQVRLDIKRAEVDRLAAELAASNGENRQLKENLRAAIHEQHRLEARLIDLGQDPGHAEV